MSVDAPFKARRDEPFGTFGRCKELPLDQMTDDQRWAYELVKEARGTVPGPYKIWLQNPDLTKVMVPIGMHYQGEAALTKAEIEIATNLTNAKWLAAYSNDEHERIAEQLGGLPAEKVESLIAGLPTSFDDVRQEVVYEMTSALLGPRVIPRGLYQKAVDLLGHAGLTDLIALVGYYTAVSLTLRAYDVPSDAEGLERPSQRTHTNRELEPSALGGRLRLLDPGALQGLQKELFEYLVSSKMPWATSSGFIGQLADGRMVGPFNVFLQSPEMGRAYNAWVDAESAHTSLAADVRQVVILTVATAWRAAYAVYAHAAVARRSGVSEETIAAVTQGRDPVGVSPAVRVANRFTRELVESHQIGDERYAEAVDLFGERGVADIVNLIGLYLATSAFLNAFRVPVPDGTVQGQHAAVTGETRQPKVTEVASFPRGYFVENIAVLSDGAMLATVATHCELWHVPPFRSGGEGDAVRLHTFEFSPMGIAEAEPDVFYVSSASFSTTGTGLGRLHRIDMRGWSPGKPIEPSTVLELTGCVGLLNGSCFVAPEVLLLADSFTRSIWRVDLSAGGTVATARKWLEHESMAHDPTGPTPRMPGVNGVRFEAKTGYLYYTSTAKGLFMRVAVDPHTYDPAGEPERVASGKAGDDFCIDERHGVAYVTTHRQNTVDCVSLKPAENEGFGHTVAGRPITEEPIGPTSIVWGRAPGDYGCVAYVTTDGGLCEGLGAACFPGPRSIAGSEPPIAHGRVRPAKVLRLEL